jgi:hypothetical protein
MLRAETKPRMSFEHLLEFVSQHDRSFLFIPALLLALVEVSYRLGPFDLKQVLEFLTFRK